MMKPLLLPTLGCAFTIGFSHVTRVEAQPAALPAGYGYLQPQPSSGYTMQAPQTRPQAAPSNGYRAPTYPLPQRQAAPSTKRSAPAPVQADLPTQVARLAASDHDQNNRISRLERDVAGIKGGSTRLAGTDGSPSALRSHTTHVVKPGDSLWAIASKHRVSPGEIMQLNRMKSDTVVIGQQLQIPAPFGSSSGGTTTQATYKPYYHDVRPGDTSSSIAKKYSVSRQSLMDANPRVDFGGGLIPGSRVIIPGKSTRVETSSAPQTSSGSYTVKPGDSLKGIAIRHGTSTANLAALNGIKDANKLVVGQRLILPGGKSSSSSRSIASSKPKSAPRTTPPASDDTIPLPGMGLMEPPPLAPVKPLPPPPASKPSTSAGDSHRGVLAYRVDPTDSIDSIASQFSTTPARIREMNHLQPTTKLSPGDEIMVPALGAVAVGN